MLNSDFNLKLTRYKRSRTIKAQLTRLKNKMISTGIDYNEIDERVKHLESTWTMFLSLQIEINIYRWR